MSNIAHLFSLNETKRGKRRVCICMIVSIILTTTLLATSGLVWWITNVKQNDQVENNIINQTINDEMLNTTTKPIKFNNCAGKHNGHNITEKAKLLNYLCGLAGKKIISGVVLTNTGTGSLRGIELIHNLTGAFPGVVSLSIPLYSAKVIEWTSFSEKVISYWNNGHLVNIFWWSSSPLGNMTSFTDINNYTDVELRWRGLIDNGGDLNKIWKHQLDLIVPYLQQIIAAGVVPIFDPFTWVNYKDLIWKGRPGVNGTMKLYQITRDYLEKHNNLTSLIWSWSIFGYRINNLTEYYPGDDYVDISSVWMGARKELRIKEYQKIVDVVGVKPMSMELRYTVPLLKLLADQPRWTWFTVSDNTLEDDKNYLDNRKMNTIFNSSIVINRKQIDFFNGTN